jgi:hypothetical protein
MGVGVLISGIALALGDFFSGVYVQNKSKAATDIESVDGARKPELDGNNIPRAKGTPEL